MRCRTYLRLAVSYTHLGAIMDTVYPQLQGTDWKGWRNWSRRNRILSLIHISLQLVYKPVIDTVNCFFEGDDVHVFLLCDCYTVLVDVYERQGE